jgi:hypothetical protein
MTDKRDEAIELAEAVTAALDGRYIIGGVIGYGRWGLTMRARDVSGRIVALKVAWKDADARDQVLRETELTSKVDVPEPLLVVETTLMASSLGDLLDNNVPVPFEKVRDILLTIGAVLDKAHSVGIVHGGILPEKIFVDDNGRYFVGDFSLRLPQAVFVEGNRPSMVGFTAYTPMEQRHDLPSADGRIDEFALAVVAYELLRGHRRWRVGAEDVLEIDAIDMVVSRPIAPGAPPMASAAIRRATSREAAFRYASVGEFVRAFAGLSRGATPAEHIFRAAPVVEEKRHIWIWLLPIAACIAALVAFQPVMRAEAIKLWKADWASGEFWHGNVEMPTKPATEVGMGPTITANAATQRSNGTGNAAQTDRGGDGKTVVTGPGVNPGRTIDPFPRVQPQGSTQGADAGPARGKGNSDRPSTPPKSTPINSAGDAAQKLSPTAPPTTTTTTKPVDKGPGSVEVSINGAGEAEVYIDGRSRGRAPLTWQGSPGKHVVALRPATAFSPALKEVTVVSGTTVHAVFTPR